MSPPTAQASGGGAAGAVEDAGLSGQIDALLAGMQDSAATLAADQTSQHVEEQLARGEEAGVTRTGPSGETPLNPGEVESLASQIDALVSEVGAGAEPSPAEASESPEVIGDRVETASQPRTQNPRDVESGFSEGPTGQTPSSEPARDTNVDLRALDEQLAAQAREPAPVLRAVAPPVAAVLPDLGASARRDEEAGAAEAAARAVAVPVAPLAVVPDKSKVPVGQRAASLLAWLGRALRSLGGLSLVLSARTLEASPKLARDTIGWIGLVTVFFACCMWAIILFFRSTPVPVVYGVASGVLEPGEPTPQARPRPQAHKQEAAGHGEEAPPGEAAGGHGAPAEAHAAPAGGH